MRIERLTPGETIGDERARALDGAVLTRDLLVDGVRWAKGRRLTSAEVVRLAAHDLGRPVTLLLPGSTDLHEDDAAARLARAAAGPGLRMRGPRESRIDLVATRDGVLRVRVDALEAVDGVDLVEVFTRPDGIVVSAGEPVASIKVAPHVVPARVLAAAERRMGDRPLVRVAGFRRWTVGVIVKEALHAPARERFETSIRTKVEALGSTVGPLRYVADGPAAVRRALQELTNGPDAVQLVLTAGSSTTDPLDPCFTAIADLGGRIVRRGAPAHPGSMLWLARLHRTSILGLPTCGAFSRATAADLLLPWLLSGAPPTRATIARLGHGGMLTRDQRYRFPAYARDLEAPEG